MNTKVALLWAAGVALVLGWLIAPPDRQASFAVSDAVGPVAGIASLDAEQINAAVANIRERQVWSASQPTPVAVAPEPAEEPPEEIKPPERPTYEGLNRFRLVGIIRVNGQAPEAILLDQKNDMRELKVSAGEVLVDSEVVLESIDATRALISLNDQTRWITLFPRPEPSSSDAMTVSAN